MSKFPPIPRLSIVVPVGRNHAAFENSLISVLENLPDGSEVLVCHDGSYDDPFDLVGEVRFVTGATNNLVDLVAAGASASHGRFVHVLAGGLRATCGWTDEAVEKFEHFDAGVVASVIRSAEHQDILAAGWCDGSSRLCQPASAGKIDVAASSTKIVGAYLHASFWRRDLLRSLGLACDLRSELDATYSYEMMIRRAGWRCVLADQSNVISDDDSVPCDDTSMGRGKRLRAIRDYFNDEHPSSAAKSAAVAMISNMLRPSMMVEALGQSLAPTIARSIASSIRVDEVQCCDNDGMIRKLPQRASTQQRRAA